jgi:hypothetical protein
MEYKNTPNMKTHQFKLAALAIMVVGFFSYSHSFCGFYVAKADAKLFNNTSQVILVRDGDRTVITMSSDFKGKVKDFAMVVPVPEVIARENIRIADRQIFDKLDAYSGPRLVEYYDHNPCAPVYLEETISRKGLIPMANRETKRFDMEENDKVVIEARYAVGEYDILVLSATESNGLKNWLLKNGYKIPEKAERVLEPYIKNNMKFFVVKVNLKAHLLQGYQTLRPLQIGFNSPKFMLPIRLGMANSDMEQDMIVYALTRTGRVEAANYRTVEIPSNRDIPTFIKPKFGQFYSDLFEKSHAATGKKSVFLEYAWDVTPSWNGMKCDPCVGPPPVNQDMLESGVWWLRENNPRVFFTRLHVRYAEERFPQDLHFLVTPNTTRFQARYVMRHPAQGDLSCDEGRTYREKLILRRQKELRELEALTNWNIRKYTKYVSEGSGWIDEKKNVVLPAVKTPKTPEGGLPVWGFFMLVLAVLGVGLYKNLFFRREA